MPETEVKPWFAEYKDDGKALAWVSNELDGIPENIKPRIERINAKLSETEKIAKDLQAPDKYELKLPEKSLLDEKRKGEIEAFAKAQNLSNKAAQAILQREHDTLTAGIEANKSALNTRSEAWLTELKADPEFGGAKLNESVALSNLMVARHGGPELVKFLEDTKMGNFPGFVKMLARIGSLTQDDKIGGGGSAGTKPIAQKTAQQRLYETVDK